MKTPIILTLIVLVGAGFLWNAQSTGAARHMRISEVYAKPIGGGALVAVLSIDNAGAPDRLVSVSSPKVDAALYSPVDDAGAPIPSGDSSLALDGAHIRASFEEPLKPGALLPLTLHFAQAGKITVKARVAAPAKTGGAPEAGLFGLGDICIAGPGEPAPAVKLTVEPEDKGWRVIVNTDEFEFSPDLMGLYHVPGRGHGHLYVGGMKVSRLLKAEGRIGALPPGRHQVRVTLNTNDHRAYVVGENPVTATATIVVD